MFLFLSRVLGGLLISDEVPVNIYFLSRVLGGLHFHFLI